ncbi:MULTISPECIES: DUF2933 domain-containing protein [Cupriavidus]
MKICHPQSPAAGTNAGRFLRFPWLLRWGGAIAMGAVALAIRQGQVASWLPFALVLLCPLMHLFHGGHGRSASPGSSNEAVDG